MIKTNLHITAARLQEWKACTDQYKLFVASFPNGVTLTRELLLKHAPDFELEWLAYKLLSPEQWEALDKFSATAAETYKEAVAPAWAVYIKARFTAESAYYKAGAKAKAAYNEAHTTAYAAFEDVLAPIKAAYEKARATALADVLSLP